MADQLSEVVLNGPDRQTGNTPVNVKYQDMGDGSHAEVIVASGVSTETTLLNAVTKLTELLTELQLKADLTEKQPVTQYLADGTEGTKITDGANSADVDGLGHLKVMEPTLLVGESFVGAVLDTNFWTATVANGGTVAQDGEVLLETNTTANGSAQLDSMRVARKIPGTVDQFRGVGHLDSDPQADNVRTIGAYDNNNGAFFKIDGTTFKVVTRSAGVDTEVSSGSFNGDVASITPDVHIHRWTIEYSAYIVKFLYDGVWVHSVVSTGDPWTRSLEYPIRLTNVNSNGNTTDNKLHFQLLCILRFGQISSEHISKYQAGTTAGRILKYGAGELSNLIISGVAQNSVITLYDNTAASGTILWSSGAMSAQTQPFSLDFGHLPFKNGLTLVISGANSNVTIVYE